MGNGAARGEAGRPGRERTGGHTVTLAAAAAEILQRNVEHTNSKLSTVLYRLDQLVEAQRKKGTVHFHRVATQGGDERRVRERREQRERGL